jgi:hypothetical protein
MWIYAESPTFYVSNATELPHNFTVFLMINRQHLENTAGRQQSPGASFSEAIGGSNMQ